MLEQLNDGRIVETPQVTTSNFVSNGNSADCVGNLSTAGQTATYGCYDGNYGVLGCYYYPYQTIWQSYPIYVCSDKTAKAIAILKALQEDKQIQCKSVTKFIALVEKISSIL